MRRVEKGRSGPADLRMVCVISHGPERTLGLAVASLDRQTSPCVRRRIVSGNPTMAEALNIGLELAADHNADLLVHLPGHVVLEPFALEQATAELQLDHHHSAEGQVFDAFSPEQRATGFSVFAVETFETQPGGARSITVAGEGGLGYRHPIWTPVEMYMECRELRPPDDRRMKGLLDQELAHNRDNKTLLCGLLGLERSHSVGPGSCRPEDLMSQFLSDTAHLSLDGSEYYVYNLKYKKFAQRLMSTYQQCKTVEER